MSRQYLAQNEDPKEIVTVFSDVSGPINVPDASLLFGGDFRRAGPDLYIENEGAASFRIPSYFSQNSAADLKAPNGAVLRGDLVELLAGPIAPGQYAQVGAVAGPGPIGQVETVEGVTSVQRLDGSVDTLQVGMKIFSRDVLATGEGAAVSVTFVDGTIFTLAASSRMVIDELIYDPEGTDNSGAFSLIQGGFVFIAGQVAKTGGMDVNTPSSTMGIRGTTVVVQVGTTAGVDFTEVTLTNDPDGDTGRVELRDADGNLIAFITDTDTKWIVSEDNGVTREVNRTLQDDIEDNILIAEAFAAFRLAVSRVDAGDTFVTLSNPVDRSRGDQQNTQSPADLNVDSIDEADGVESPPRIETDDTDDDSGQFDEGLIIDNIGEGPTFQFTGLEDATTGDPIDGAISLSTQGASFTLASGPVNGTVQLNANGAFEYVPSANFNGTDGFTYVAVDTNGEVFEGTVTVNVLPVNDAPVARDSTAAVNEDGVVIGSLNVTDIDGDTLSYLLNAVPANGEVALLSNGTFAYTPDLNFSGVDSFSVIVSDPSGETAETTVSVTINSVNDLPIITTAVGQAEGAVTEGVEQVDASGQLSASDVDPAATLTWTGVSAAVFGVFAIDAAGAWTYTLNNTLADSISVGETVIERFTATVRDELGGEVDQIVEVTVTGTNDAPLVTRNSVFEATVNEQISEQLVATDVDSTGALTFAIGSDAPDNGTVTINADGSFVYVPDVDFVGLDRFEYTVTDAEGAVSTGRATAIVEAASGGSGSNAVSVGFVAEATAENAAGAVIVDAAAANPVAVNLVVAMDSSGSIGPDAWEDQKEAVEEAISLLADQFAGSSTEVNVQIITYSGRINSIGPFDLQDPTLPGEILALPYLQGSTAWNLALDEANDFFTAQEPDDANFLLFITDGVPSNGAWRASLDALQNPPGDGFTVDIQAFGIGNGFNPTLLQEIDPEPTELSGPGDLTDALTETPVFAPMLISLDVELEADGVDHGIIATELNDALIVEGIDYELPLAAIENIETLLGEDNRVSVTARFDLDGDANTAEIELFKSDSFGKASAAQTIAGLDGDDLLFGSDEDDVIEGAAGNDVILSFDGSDVIDGGAGADVVLAGGGDDVLRVGEVPTGGLDVLDGGVGRDILQIDVSGNLTDDLIPSLDIRDVEAIDMENGLANTLELTLSDVVDLSSTADSLLEALLAEALPESAVIYGDAVDTLELVDGATGGFEKVAGAPVVDGNGNTLDIYTYVDGGNVLATLGVDTDVDVVVSAPVV